MKKNTTKRSLLASVLALVMCVTMLVGTTFAWFTDSASTSVNKIEAGKLKVDIVAEDPEADGTYPSLTGEGSKLNFVKAKGAESERILWEPGCTYQTEGFRIQNKGSLALKWKVQINKSWTAEKEIHGHELLDVIDFSIVDEQGNEIPLESFTGVLNTANAVSGVYRLQGKMKTTAGNEYQGLVLPNVTITVFATQNTYESDSTGNGYDADAQNPQVTNQAEFLTALNSAVDGDTIYLAAGDYGTIEMIHAFKNSGVKNITLVGADGASVGLWFGKDCKPVNGWTFRNINFTGMGLVINCVNNDVKVENCTFTGGLMESTGAGAYASNLTIKDCTFKDTTDKGMPAVYIGENNGVSITGCTFTNVGYNAIQIAEMHGNVTVENNSIDGTSSRALRFTQAAAGEEVKVTIKNNTVANGADEAGEVLKANDKNYVIDFESNTWDGKTDAEMTKLTEGGHYIVKLPG